MDVRINRGFGRLVSYWQRLELRIRKAMKDKCWPRTVRVNRSSKTVFYVAVVTYQRGITVEA